jgi:hypothetical protein
MWKINPEDKHIYKNKDEHIHTHVCNSRTTPWNLKKEEKKRE